MGIHRGPNTVKDGLVFGYDTGYGVADNSTATRFYPGEPTGNVHPHPLDIYAQLPQATSVRLNQERDTSVSSPLGGIPYKMTPTGNDPYMQTYQSGTYNLASAASGQTWTASVYVKANRAIAASIFIFEANSSGNYNGATANTVNISTEWQRISVTRTFNQSNTAYVQARIDGPDTYAAGDILWFDGYQVEQQSDVTPFVNGTRSSTASLIDLKKTADIDVSIVSFNSTGQPIFDGSNDKIVVPNQISTGSYTYETVVKISSSDSSYSGFGSNFKSDSSGYSGVGNGWVIRLDPDGGLQIYTKNNSTTLLNPINISGFRAANVNKYIHLVYTYSNGSNKLYLNGVLQATGTGLSGTTPSDSTLIIGAYSWGISSQTYYINAHQPIAKLYNQTHTATEIKQNYNAYKNRFDI